MIFSTTESKSQCPFAGNFDVTAGVPLNPTLGGWTGFQNAIWGGDYILVNVCLGATYTFTMLDELLVGYDPEMTLRNNAGGGFLAYNDDYNLALPFPGNLLPQITWTATFTGTVRVLIDEAPGCVHNCCFPSPMDLIVYQLSACGVGGGPALPCNADVGTFTILQNGVPATSPIYLCTGNTDCITFTSNVDFILPPPPDNNPLEAPELMWAIYTGPPTTGDPSTDPNFSGFYWTGQDFSDCNPGAGLPPLIGSNPIYYVPITADDGDNVGNPNGVIHHDQDGDGCFDLGNFNIEVNYLNPITSTTTSNSCAGTVSITISGGEPEFAANNYTTIANTGAGTLTGTPISHGGTVTITGLTNGQNWSIVVTDANGCTATFNGTFSGDVTLPVINCPGNITVSNTPGTCGALVNYAAPVGTDNCPAPVTSLTAGQASGTVFPVGTTTVTYLVTDAIGNTATCSFTVTVNDTENPTISCPGNITVSNDVGTCGATVNYATPSGLDNCPAPITTITAGQASGTVFPVGTTTVTYLVTDASGNTATCSFTVTVNDTENPTISCPGNIIQCNLIATWAAPTGLDNCAGASTSQTSGLASGSTFPVGITTIQYTVIDAVGNSTICSFTVEISPQDDPSFSYSSGTYCLTGADPLPITVATAGGTFTISAPGVIDPTTGLVNLTASGLGTFTITYNTTSAGNLCPNSTTVQITITSAPAAGFSYDSPTYCQNDAAPILTFSAGASGGTFTSTPAGLNLNGTSGVVDLTLSTPGFYTVYNTIVAAGGCAAALDSTTIEIFQVDSALFNYSSGTYCLTGTDPIAVMGGNATPGGTFTITAPGVINAGDGTIDLGASGLGTYTIYYNTTSAGNPCPA
ncbi:MAG: hypothetical protein COA97_04540, partial [Flavobacteriales bacterium]